MLFQLILNIIVFFLKIAMWIALAVLAIPAGIYALMNNFFPAFVEDANAWFWIIFSIIVFVAYVILWKPIIWLVGGISVLSAGQ